MNLIATNYLTATLSAANDADIITSWKDANASASSGLNSKISDSTAVKTIVPAPGTGGVRRVTDVNLTIPRDSAGCRVTIHQTDGTTSWEVTSADLVAGDSLIYDHNRGWSVRATVMDGNSMAGVIRELHPSVLI